jgi:polysaccharide export outer membrane protein
MRIRSTFVTLFLIAAALVAAPAAAQPAAGAAVVPLGATAKTDAKPDEAYVLGAEDVIEIEVLGRNDFKVRSKIGSDGNIQLPFLGTVQASARTGKQLAAEVGAALEKGGYYSKPIMRVEVVGYASRYVTVLGSVGNPGLVPIDRPYRLSEVLARVGGVRENAADYLLVTPESGPQKRLSIKGISTGDGQQDPYVAPGDKISIPAAEIFYISGQVRNPGPFPVTDGMTVRQAIAKAGGLTELGTDKGVKITHPDGKTEKVRGEAKVLPGDVVVINERFF